MAEAPYVLEGEVIVREGESRQPAIVWEDFSTLGSASTGSTSIDVYINGSSETATYAPGSPTFTGNVMTLPLITFQTGSGGVTVVVEAATSANSQVWKTAIVYRVLKPGAAR